MHSVAGPFPHERSTHQRTYAVEQDDHVRAESIGCNILREGNYAADEKDDSGGREKQTEASIHDVLDCGEYARAIHVRNCGFESFDMLRLARRPPDG